LNAALNIYHLLNCVCWRNFDVIFCDQALASGVRSVRQYSLTSDRMSGYYSQE